MQKCEEYKILDNFNDAACEKIKEDDVSIELETVSMGINAIKDKVMECFKAGEIDISE